MNRSSPAALEYRAALLNSGQMAEADRFPAASVLRSNELMEYAGCLAEISVDKLTRAAAAALWLHGAAADCFCAGLTAKNLPDCLPPALQSLARLGPH